MSFLDRFPVVLLDMNGTFMFGEDRFGREYDYAATYRDLGGRMAPGRVGRLVQTCFDSLLAQYSDPAYQDCFPTVSEVLRALPDAAELGEDAFDRLERTFAVHELGRIPAEYAEAVRRLARGHRLGLVADVWSRKEPWLEALQQAGLGEVFEVLVFSSEIGSVKPSPRPFRRALVVMDVQPAECVYVGDSVRRDVRGAKAAGLATVWIGQGAVPQEADWAVPDLLAL